MSVAMPGDTWLWPCNNWGGNAGGHVAAPPSAWPCWSTLGRGRAVVGTNPGGCPAPGPCLHRGWPCWSQAGFARSGCRRGWHGSTCRHRGPCQAHTGTRATCGRERALGPSGTQPRSTHGCLPQPWRAPASGSSPTPAKPGHILHPLMPPTVPHPSPIAHHLPDPGGHHHPPPPITPQPITHHHDPLLPTHHPSPIASQIVTHFHCPPPISPQPIIHRLQLITHHLHLPPSIIMPHPSPPAHHPSSSPTTPNPAPILITHHPSIRHPSSSPATHHP